MKRQDSIKTFFLLSGILLFSIPLAAETPAAVEHYCTNFNAAACAANASWFMIDSCKSMIHCVSDVDPETLEFKGCRTVLKNVFDDCDKYPTTLCYNGVAYDTSTSETCNDGGARFKKVDSCGNPKEDGPCIQLATCQEKIVHPYTGTSITIHEQCVITNGTAARIESSVPDDNKDSNSNNNRDHRSGGRISTPYVENIGESETQENVEQASANIENRTRPTQSQQNEGKTLRTIPKSPNTLLIMGGILIILLLIVIATTWRLLYKR